MSAKEEGQAAVRALDQALAAKPKKDGHAFSELTERLCNVRTILIGKRRDGTGGDALERLNALISVSLAGHFPLGSIPWPEIENARADLQEMVSTLV